MDFFNFIRNYSFNFTDLFIDLIDIIIVAFVIYKLMMLIKGTRAVQLLKGLVVLLVATAVSYWLGLDTVHWLLRQTMTALVVALPIVFQPELRRALEKIGGGRFFTSSLTIMTEDDRTKVITEIVRAVQKLKEDKTGALIVMERGTGLEEYIDSGISMDALISAELLQNIFTNKTPLHDGAVIIRGNRIAAAACVLPLTGSAHLPKKLGTRHRAGVGITENSDALAIIVSEETGEISLTFEGILKKNLKEEELQRELFRAFKTRTFQVFSPFKNRR